jgi:hypothetical protein
MIAVLSSTGNRPTVKFVKTCTNFENMEHPHYRGQRNEKEKRITNRRHVPRMIGVKATLLQGALHKAAVKRLSDD